jgi:hypothetical protein
LSVAWQRIDWGTLRGRFRLGDVDPPRATVGQ